MIGTMVLHSRQRLGCLRRILDYLDLNTLQLAYKVFIRPMMEYGNVAIMGASTTQLGGLDTIQMPPQNCVIHLLFLLSVVVMLLQLDCY